MPATTLKNTGIIESPIAEEQAYRRLKRMILTAELQPGARLVHRNLAEELGMSRNPVVLALRLLEQDGLVKNTPGIGACVRAWSRDELVDLYHIRASLEGLAARMCAERATRVDLAQIETANEAFIEATAQRDLDKVVATDIAFHESVVGGAHSSYLQDLVGNLSIISLSIRMLIFKAHQPEFAAPDDRVRLHIPIVEALRDGDGGMAAKAAETHALNKLEDHLENYHRTLELVQATG